MSRTDPHFQASTDRANYPGLTPDEVKKIAMRRAAEQYAKSGINRIFDEEDSVSNPKPAEDSSPTFDLRKTEQKNPDELSHQLTSSQAAPPASADIPSVSGDGSKAVDQEQLDNYHQSWQDYWQKYYHQYYSGYYEKYFGEVKQKVDDHNLKSHLKMTEFFEDNRRLASEKKRLEDPEAIRRDILNRIVDRGKSSTFWGRIRLHVRALTLAGTAICLFLFIQFNPIVVGAAKQYLGPSSSESLPTIIEPSSSNTISQNPSITVPKIGVSAPVVYNEPSPYDGPVQKALENGVVRYWNTATPGEDGNVVILGHSSNNILNSGQYKYVFVNLKRLEADDIIYLDYEGTRYAYKVTDKQVVPPEEFGHIYPTDVPSLTLITCDPPGTNYNRLYVRAVQISPDPSRNTELQEDVSKDSAAPEFVPSTAPSFWERIF